MALKRGQELSRGVRRTQLENSFGVVSANTASLGQIGGKLAETAEKITLFQADIMDKEWQNDFDKNSSIFIAEETRKELNSPNPDLVGLQQKLLTYKDSLLREAPARFANYVTNKLDISFAENINLVKDYANDVKYNNLLTDTENLEQQYLAETSNYVDQVIAQHPQDLETQQQLIQAHYNSVVTPNIDRIAKNYESLNLLKPLKITPGYIENRIKLYQIDFLSEKMIGDAKSIIGAIDFENNTALQNADELMEARKLINDLRQDFIENPDSREMNNLTDEQVALIDKKFTQETERLLNLESEKIEQSEIALTKVIEDMGAAYINEYQTNAFKAISSNPSAMLEELASNQYFSQRPELALKVLDDSIRAANIHKVLAQIKEENNGTMPVPSPTLSTLVETRAGVSLEQGELNQYLFNMNGTQALTTNEYMKLVSDRNEDPNYGAKLDNFKTINQIELEKYNLFRMANFEKNLANGIYPPDAAQVFAGVDAILMKDKFTDADLEQINNVFRFYRVAKGNNAEELFAQNFGEASEFFQYLDGSRNSDLFGDAIITEIGSLRGMLEEFRNNKKQPFDIEAANQYLADNDLSYITTDLLETKILEDISTQYGVGALMDWFMGKNKTDAYTDLFNIPESQRIVMGILQPLTVSPETFRKANAIQIDPVVESQLQNQYILELKKAGVDFSLAGKDDQLLQSQIKEHQEMSLTRAVRFLRDNNFGVSSYQSPNGGAKLVYDPVDNKIPYDNKADKDMYVAVHFYNRIKDMEEKYTKKYMLDTYPDLYIKDMNTQNEQSVNFDLNRAYEIAIDNKGVFFTREPGTDVYRYNLNQEVFINSQRTELDGDIDDPQYFRPDDVLVVGGQLFSRESVIGGAIDKFLDKQPDLAIFERLGIGERGLKNFLYSVYYPGMRLMTSTEDIIDYLEKQTSSITGKIE